MSEDLSRKQKGPKLIVEYAPNPLSKGPDDKFFFQKTKTQTLDLEQIVQIMADKMPGVPKEVMMMSVVNYNNTLMQKLLEGNTISTPLFHAHLSLSGNSPDGSWNPEVNSVEVKFRPGIKAQQAFDNARVEVRGRRQDGYYISGVVNNETGVNDNTGCAGSFITIYGRNLKVAGDSPEVGIKLVNVATQQEFAVRKNMIPVNHFKKVVAMLPANMPVGDYRLTIYNQARINGDLFTKTIREMSVDIYVAESVDE